MYNKNELSEKAHIELVKIAEELKISQEFSFDNDGLAQSVDWLNTVHPTITKKD